MSAPVLLRTTRRAAGLTQSELAARLRMGQAAIAGLERPGANLTLATLEEALDAMGHRLELRAVPDTSGVDETLIARNLRMSPAERLVAFETAHREVEELRQLMRASGGSG